jgi:hypothetical protein
MNEVTGNGIPSRFSWYLVKKIYGNEELFKNPEKYFGVNQCIIYLTNEGAYDRKKAQIIEYMFKCIHEIPQMTGKEACLLYSQLEEIKDDLTRFKKHYLKHPDIEWQDLMKLILVYSFDDDGNLVSINKNSIMLAAKYM